MGRDLLFNLPGRFRNFQVCKLYKRDKYSRRLSFARLPAIDRLPRCSTTDPITYYVRTICVSRRTKTHYPTLNRNIFYFSRKTKEEENVVPVDGEFGP